MKKVLLYGYLFCCVAVMLTTTANAYLDPSVMTYTIQVVAGVASWVLTRTPRKKWKRTL